MFGSRLRGSEPQNLSYPLRLIEGSITASNRFFVRDHFPPPEISLETWKLHIAGRVETPYDLNFSDLVELPSKRIEAVIECAGNVPGGAAVSNGVWEGIPISVLLEKAKPTSDAMFLMLEGADSGRLLPDYPALSYSQLVPIDKGMDSSSLVAYKLNDLTLPQRNGFPARALFPGWYGMNSVKWLQRIVVLAKEDRDAGFYKSGMTRVYNRVIRTGATDSVTRVSSVQVKSVIAWPGDAVKLPAGRHVVWGFAWGGTGRIREVAITTDAGKVWKPAKLEPPASDHAWVKWTFAWDVTPGDYTMMSRASDGNGNEQPLHRAPARKDAYELNWCMPLHCSVR